MVVASTENFRFRLTTHLKDQWKSLCDGKNISQQDAVESLLKWFVRQDDDLQSMILGQTKVKPDLVRLVLMRLAADSGVEVPVVGQPHGMRVAATSEVPDVQAGKFKKGRAT